MDLLRSILRHAGGILVILLLIPFVLLSLFASALFWLILNLAVWILWIPRGKNTLFIYSESPNWHEHVQEHLLPRVQDRAVVLNWTERRKWQRLPTLSNLAFTFLEAEESSILWQLFFDHFGGQGNSDFIDHIEILSTGNQRLLINYVRTSSRFWTNCAISRRCITNK